jgi:hypothetical protein
MTEGGYFDEDAFDAGLADGAVQAMARRQLSVSLAVALAMLAAAGLALVGEHRTAPIGMAAQQRIMRAEPPRLEVAQPAPAPATRG